MIRGTAGVHPRCTRVGGRFRVAVGASATLLWFPRAPVAQGIEHRPPEAGAGVRIAPGAPRLASTNAGPRFGRRRSWNGLWDGTSYRPAHATPPTPRPRPY